MSVQVTGALVVSGPLIARNARFLNAVSGNRVQDWEAALLELSDRAEAAEKDNSTLKRRVEELERKSDEMYYAPGMPGFVAAAARFDDVASGAAPASPGTSAFGTGKK
jgi:hypothetical protein